MNVIFQVMETNLLRDPGVFGPGSSLKIFSTPASLSKLTPQTKSKGVINSGSMTRSF